MTNLKVFIKADAINQKREVIWECFVTTEELDTYKMTLERLAKPTLDEIRLMFISEKEKFSLVED
tara:strand:- start:492 stop:686 length:195 start_codon:yes stop_codon:yes gene_type:complete